MAKRTKMNMVANMTVLPPNMKPADDHLINGLPIGECAIRAGKAYALTTIILVINPHNSIHLPVYGSDM